MCAVFIAIIIHVAVLRYRNQLDLLCRLTDGDDQNRHKVLRKSQHLGQRLQTEVSNHETAEALFGRRKCDRLCRDADINHRRLHVRLNVTILQDDDERGRMRARLRKMQLRKGGCPLRRREDGLYLLVFRRNIILERLLVSAGGRQAGIIHHIDELVSRHLAFLMIATIASVL